MTSNQNSPPTGQETGGSDVDQPAKNGRDEHPPEPLAEHFQESAAIGFLNAEPAIFRGLEVSATGGTAWDGEGEMPYGQISVSLDVPDTHLNFSLQLRSDQARKIAYDLLDAVGEEREGRTEGDA